MRLFLRLKNETNEQAKANHCTAFSSVREIERTITSGDYDLDDGDEYEIFDDTGKTVYAGEVWIDDMYDVNTEGRYLCEQAAKQEGAA